MLSATSATRNGSESTGMRATNRNALGSGDLPQGKEQHSLSIEHIGRKSMIKAITENGGVAVEISGRLKNEILLEFIAITKAVVDGAVIEDRGKAIRSAILAAVNKTMSEVEEEENGQQNSNDQP